MIIFLSSFVISGVYDNFGVEFSDDTYKRLTLAPESLLQYEIPEMTEIIAGGKRSGEEEYSAFYLCRNNLQQLSFHKSSKLRMIEPYGFYGFTKLKVVNMSTCRNLTVISNGAFQWGTSIELIILPPNIEEISGGAFYRTTSLTEISFPSSLKIITGSSDYSSSFGFCLSLAKISFEETASIKKIESTAFDFCPISNLYIPLSLCDINGWSCRGSSISNITVEENHEYFSIYEGCLYNKNFSEIIIVPKSIKGTYKIHEKTNIIGFASFSGCLIENISIPNTVEILRENSFRDSHIKEIALPQTLKIIESAAFFDCTKLEIIDVNVSISSIKKETFCQCTNLNTVVLSNCIQSICVRAFSYCKSLDYLFVPKKYHRIGIGMLFSHKPDSCHYF